MQTVREPVKVVVPDDLDGDAEVAVDLADAGYSALDCAGFRPAIVGKVDALGAAVPADETVTLTGTTLTIAEGDTGLAAGDVFTVELQAGIPVLTAEVVEAGT